MVGRSEARLENYTTLGLSNIKFYYFGNVLL